MIEMLKTREILKEHKKHYLCWSSCETGRRLLSRCGEAGRREWMGSASSAWGAQIPPAQNSVSSKRVLQSSVCVCVCVCVVAQSCPTLCDHMDCNPPDSPVPGTFQARILEWAAICYSRRSSWHRDWTQASSIACIGRQILYHWATWKAP